LPQKNISTAPEKNCPSNLTKYNETGNRVSPASLAGVKAGCVHLCRVAGNTV